VHIRNISEIGLVFPADGFDNKVNNLLNEYALSYFDKQPPIPHFRAVGNDEGLFIIVPEHRVWFSTKNMKSKIFPMQIIFIANSKLHKLNF
jgi:hypothetical protein